MKIIHAACLLNPSIGIIKQMQWENTAAINTEKQFESVLGTTRNFAEYSFCKTFPVNGGSIYSYIKLRVLFWIWLLKKSREFDLVMLRYSMHDPFQWIGSFFLGKYITVHHTFEIEELHSKSSRFSNFLIILEKFFGGGVLKRAKGFVGVTNEITQYELYRTRGNKLGFTYPNGINTGHELDDMRSGDTPELIFVAAQFSPWIGLDLLIDSILKNDHLDKNLKFHIHLVGNIGDEDKKRVSNDPRFTIHGVLSGNDLKNIYARSWLAISSFGFYRKNMKEACTLKTREYLSHGIPTVGGYIEVGFPTDFKYYQNIECDINEIVEHACYHKNSKRKEVINTSMKYIKKENLLDNLITELKKIETK